MARSMGLVSRIQATRSKSLLPELLKSLHDLLVDHFAHEQFPGGLYESMGANQPEHHETLKVLVREHCEILSAARGLVEHASQRPVDDELHNEIAQVLRMLREHESREHALAQAIADSLSGADAHSA